MRDLPNTQAEKKEEEDVDMKPDEKSEDTAATVVRSRTPLLPFVYLIL